MGKYDAFNFQTWINDHRHLLKPPVGNKMVWKEREFIVMVVGGPNLRSDFHINQGEEFFYQLEGQAALRIIDDEGMFRDIKLNQGDIYLLPPGVPHSPQRAENSVGLVIERKRQQSELDQLVWFCEKCNNELYRESFHLVDIESSFGPVYERYFGQNHRQCQRCSHLNGKTFELKPIQWAPKC